MAYAVGVQVPLPAPQGSAEGAWTGAKAHQSDEQEDWRGGQTPSVLRTRGAQVPLPALVPRGLAERLPFHPVALCTTMNSRPGRRKADSEDTPRWEDILIILSILTLWPTVLRRENVLTRSILILALLILAWIFLRRLRRFTKLLEGKQGE